MIKQIFIYLFNGIFNYLTIKYKCSDSPLEVEDMWSKVSREKAAGGYPWTHLNHNLQEEVWINPLNLPQDITRYRQL